jgi:amidase
MAVTPKSMLFGHSHHSSNMRNPLLFQYGQHAPNKYASLCAPRLANYIQYTPAMSKFMSTNNQPIYTPPLRHATLSDIYHGLEHDIFTAEQLTKVYSTRIHEVNPEFHAVIEANPHAADDARLLDTEYRLCGPRGPLHRIPIFLKDNIPTLDDTETTCGSLALVGARPAKEAAVVTALRKAGAIILGKANMAEWSGFRSTSGCSGWSARGGQTRGIFYPNMKASGSSSGCAVAVALGLCVAAIGTEVGFVYVYVRADGLTWCMQACYSVVSPAERSGIVGFKPTRNLISSEGIIHASKKLDTVGLLTRNVDDAVQILLELTRQSTHLPCEMQTKLHQAVSPACSTLDLTGVRIGIPWHLPDLTTLHAAKLVSFKTVLALLKRANATLVHSVHITGASAYSSLSTASQQTLLDTDMKTAINTYLSPSPPTHTTSTPCKTSSPSPNPVPLKNTPNATSRACSAP